MSADADRFATASLAEIERDGFRADPVERPRLTSTEWALSYLEPWEYQAIAVFLRSLVARPPLNGPTFAGHRMVLTALASDLTIAANEDSNAV